MCNRIPIKRNLVLFLAGLLVLATAGTGLAQNRPDTAAEAVEMHTWFEAVGAADLLDEALRPMLTAQRVRSGQRAQDGFLPPLRYNPDQLTRSARNLGPGGTLKVWTNLFCQTRNLNQQASLRGVLRYQVWVEDSATGKMRRLTKLRARADGGSVFEESGFKLPKLNKGDTLWFQILRDSVSPVRNAYCTFAYGIYRNFTGDSGPGVEAAQ